MTIKLGKIAGVCVGLLVGSMLVYWFNLDNKLIYYVVRPLLNRWYGSRKRDFRL